MNYNNQASTHKFYSFKTFLIAGFLFICLCPITPIKAAAQKRTASITISAAGDCTLGVDSRYNNTFNNYYRQHGSTYFFKKVKPIFKNDDVTIVNLEGTLTSSGSRAYKKYTFKGPKSYVGILKKGSVEVVNVANNHTMDFGAKGFSDTKNTLKKNNISYCINETIAYKNINGVKIAFLGFNKLNGVSSETVKKEIKKAKKKGAKLVIVSFHWGIELDYYPRSEEKSMARSAIDGGAALVLGHHPHVLQGIEKYKGRYIVYSLGNFCFGGNVNPRDKDTAIFQQTFTIKNGKLTKANNAKIIPCSLSSTAGTNDFQPKSLSGSSKKRLISKLRHLSSGMNVTIRSNGRLK